MDQFRNHGHCLPNGHSEDLSDNKPHREQNVIQNVCSDSGNFFDCYN